MSEASGAAPPLALRAGWAGEARAGTAAAATALPLVLTLAALAYAPLGAAAAAHGTAAGVGGVVVGGLAMAAASRAALPTAGPSSATALIHAGVVAELAADARADLASVLAVAAAMVVGAGALLALLGLLRLGSLARFVPRPVLAGFMNAVALLILVAQLPPLLGLTKAELARDGLAALQAAQPAALLLSLGTAAVALGLGRRRPALPAALIALAAGTLAVELARLAWPALGALARVGDMPPAALPQPTALAPLWPGGWALLERHAVGVALGALLLALIGGLESMLGMLAVEQTLNVRGDPNRELLALGAANVASGLVGGIPVMFLRIGAVAAHRAGGRSRRAAVALSRALARAFALGAPLVARVPLAVLAGLMLTIAFAMIDGWTRQLVDQWRAGDRSADLVQSLWLVAAVCAATLAFGFVAGVAAGVLIAMLVFVRVMNRSLLRSRCSAAELPSRRVYPARFEAALQALRRRIEIVELEGALFFGSSERLAAEAERIGGETAFVVLDCRRVTTIDASGAVALVQLADRLAARGVTLLLAGVTRADRLGRTLQALGAWRSEAHPDADRATEAAELALLARAGLQPLRQAVPLRRCALFDGVDEPAFKRVASLLSERRLAAGERLFAEGDAGDAVYVVVAGSVSVVGAPAADGGGRQRFVSFSPGMTFGETAVLDGRGRTGDAVADIDSTVFALAAGDLAALQASHPAAVARMYRNLALHLSERLRGAAIAWRRAAR